MRLSLVLGLAVAGSLMMGTAVMAQRAGGGRGAGRGAGMMPQAQWTQTLVALGDLNLRPEFTLTKEQKEKLQAIRDEVKKGEDQWRADHAVDIRKLQDDMQAARQAQDQAKIGELRPKMMELMQTMPKTDEAVAKVKALLSEDQVKALETRITERQEEMRSGLGAMGPGGGGGRGAGGRGAAAGGAK